MKSAATIPCALLNQQILMCLPWQLEQAIDEFMQRTQAALILAADPSTASNDRRQLLSAAKLRWKSNQTPPQSTHIEATRASHRSIKLNNPDRLKNQAKLSKVR